MSELDSKLPALTRRGFLGLTAGVAVTAALAACSGPSTSSSGSSSAAAKIDYTGVKPAPKITFWSSDPGNSHEVTQSIVDKFNASQSDIKVELVSAGANYEETAQKFQAAQAGGTLPDLIVLSDVWWFRYLINDAIIPLDSLFEILKYDLGDYREQLVKDYKYKDSTWAVPWARSTPLFYYNKAHWSAAGLPDRAPNTWDEFSSWIPKLTSANSGVSPYQLPALAGYAGWSFQNNLWGWGGGWSKQGSFDIICNEKEAVAAMKWLQDLVYKQKAAGVSAKDATNDLSAGAVSSTVGSTGNLVSILKVAKFELGAGPLPGGPKSQSPVCPTGGAGVAIPKKIAKENQLAAATFAKFLTSPENTVTFAAATGYLPIRKSANVSSLTSATPLAQVAIDQLSKTRDQDWARVFLPGADQEMAKTCAAILTQQADVQKSLDALKTTLEGIYTDQVKPHVSK